MKLNQQFKKFKDNTQEYTPEYIYVNVITIILPKMRFLVKISISLIRSCIYCPHNLNNKHIIILEYFLS